MDETISIWVKLLKIGKIFGQNFWQLGKMKESLRTLPKLSTIGKNLTQLSNEITPPPCAFVQSGDQRAVGDFNTISKLMDTYLSLCFSLMGLRNTCVLRAPNAQQKRSKDSVL